MDRSAYSQVTNASRGIIPLSIIRHIDAQFVGNKAASLGELYSEGIAVPDGFCINSEVLTAIIESIRPFRSSTKTHPAHSVLDFQSLEADVLKAHFPTNLADDIKSAVVEVHPVCPTCQLFSVRSSASVEDSPNRSFAGQFHTSIGVATHSEILLAVKKCWASLFNVSVRDYLIESATELTDVRMGVLVQSLVPAEKAGVMFTRDPLTGERVTIIEAAWGLGGPVVGGEVTPDHVRLAPSGESISYRIGSKRHALVVMEGKLYQHPVSASEAAAPCLDRTDLEQLAAIARRIERLRGPWQDIEFAFYKKQLWILQARPITAIGNAVRHDIGGDW